MAKAHPEARAPEYFNFATDIVDRWADSNPRLQAMLWVDDQQAQPRSLTYSHFRDQSHKAAHLLRQLGLKPGDRLMITLNRIPAWSWFAAWNNGSTLFINDSKGAFSARGMLDVLNRYPITTLCAPPTAYRQLVTEEACAYFADHAPRALEQCVSAGEALNAETHRLWREMSGIGIRDGYGQTETTMIVGNFPGMKIKPGGLGKPMPGVEVSIIDGSGRVVDTNTEGDIAVKICTEHGERLMGIYDGYISSNGSVSRPVRPSQNSQGKVNGEWHITGDRGYSDEDGYFWFVGRADDVISSSGYRIGPFEVESVLKQHPAVIEAAAVASPGPHREEVVKAFIVLAMEWENTEKAGLTEEIQTFCKKEAAPYKYPRKIQFVRMEDLPTTISGKIQRGVLRKSEFQRAKASGKLS
ncbi:hypothetical protein LTR93_011156 [Exophiala xenobiotica]|nr:hypothetical protein LTR93_011156 [Exophiala xenobiotica]